MVQGYVFFSENVVSQVFHIWGSELLEGKAGLPDPSERSRNGFHLVLNPGMCTGRMTIWEQYLGKKKHRNKNRGKKHFSENCP